MRIIEGLGLSEDVNRRLREYIITQLLNFLRFLLAVNEICDSDTTTYYDVCEDERHAFLQYHFYPKCTPNFNCLWDIIFNSLDIDIKIPFTPILGAYCRSYKINSKKDLYVKMSAELECWLDTINRFEDIVIIAIGMSQKIEIHQVFYQYTRNFNEHPITKKFYIDALDILKKNNFKNIDPDSYFIQPDKIIRTKYDDPLQQVFYEYIMRERINYQQFLPDHPTAKNVCDQLSSIIYHEFNVKIQIHSLDNDIALNNIIDLNNIIEQIKYFESKIPQYPDEIKAYLSILASTDLYITSYIEFEKLAKMSELSKYNLRNLPIYAMIHGYCGAIPIKNTIRTNTRILCATYT